MSKNLSALSGRKGLEDNLFRKLKAAAANTGTPSPERLRELADEYLFGQANLLGAASFYDFLKPGNEGKKAWVCNGSACLVAGTQSGIHKALENVFQPNEIGEVCCLGRCHENGAFKVGSQNYSGIKPENIPDILLEKQAPVSDRYTVASAGEKVLTSDFPGVPAYYETLRKVLDHDPALVLDQIKFSGLRGRGGAGYPLGLKLESCKRASGDSKYIVCNADEGDPGSYSDRYLLEYQPHSVLFGMIAAGFAIGAHDGVLYIRTEYPDALRIIREAIAELEKGGYCGADILESGFSFRFHIIEAAGAYVCGEETALLSSIEGQRPEVRIRPPYPVEYGLFGKPTVVSNVETLASFHFILEKGAGVYRRLGTTKCTGTKLVSVNGLFKKPGVFEVPMGTPLRVLTDQLAGGFSQPVKALQIGGPLGGIVPVSALDELTLDFESFTEKGFSLGHGSMLAIPADFPMIRYLAHLFEFSADESCGKCFPCRLGTVRGKELIEKAMHQDYLIDPELFTDLLETLENGSLCGLGFGLPMPVRNALQHFQDELQPFFQKDLNPQP
jgi:NADH-quinone oxidoreductase subunit F